jgi:hypothetical protein
MSTLTPKNQMTMSNQPELFQLSAELGVLVLDLTRFFTPESLLTSISPVLEGIDPREHVNITLSRFETEFSNVLQIKCEDRCLVIPLSVKEI